jgi:hypothetical protein
VVRYLQFNTLRHRPFLSKALPFTPASPYSEGYSNTLGSWDTRLAFYRSLRRKTLSGHILLVTSSGFANIIFPLSNSILHDHEWRA